MDHAKSVSRDLVQKKHLNQLRILARTRNLGPINKVIITLCTLFIQNG
jgi:hypothetical protein